MRPFQRTATCCLALMALLIVSPASADELAAERLDSPRGDVLLPRAAGDTQLKPTGGRVVAPPKNNSNNGTRGIDCNQNGIDDACDISCGQPTPRRLISAAAPYVVARSC